MMIQDKEYTPEEIIDLITSNMEKIDETRLYYELKKAKMRFFQQGFKYIKCVLALDMLGLPINVNIVHSVFNTKTDASVRVSLHRLGDIHILTQKRDRYNCYYWVVNSWFKEKVVKIA